MQKLSPQIRQISARQTPMNDDMEQQSLSKKVAIDGAIVPVPNNSLPPDIEETRVPDPYGASDASPSSSLQTPNENKKSSGGRKDRGESEALRMRALVNQTVYKLGHGGALIEIITGLQTCYTPGWDLS